MPGDFSANSYRVTFSPALSARWMCIPRNGHSRSLQEIHRLLLVTGDSPKKAPSHFYRSNEPTSSARLPTSKMSELFVRGDSPKKAPSHFYRSNEPTSSARLSTSKMPEQFVIGDPPKKALSHFYRSNDPTSSARLSTSKMPEQFVRGDSPQRAHDCALFSSILCKSMPLQWNEHPL